MIRLRKLDDSVKWRTAGLDSPAPTDKRALKLALKELDLPPVKEPAKVVLP